MTQRETDQAEPIAEFDLRSAAETELFAGRLSGALATGDVFLLSGDLGAGKTAFVRSVIQSLQAQDGAVEHVPSPTFTLVQTYSAAGFEIWHADLYRIGDPGEIAELGFDDAGEDAVLFVEWPENGAGLWPDRAIWLRLEITGTETRRLAIYGGAEATRVAKALGRQ